MPLTVTFILFVEQQLWVCTSTTEHAQFVTVGVNCLHYNTSLQLALSVTIIMSEKVTRSKKERITNDFV